MKDAASRSSSPRGSSRLAVSVCALALGISAFAGCSGDDAMTLGEVCSRTGQPICSRMVACGLDASMNTCLSAYQDGCCGNDGTCDKKAPSKQDEQMAEELISECSSAIKTFDCSLLLDEHELPSGCGGEVYASRAAPGQVGAASRMRLGQLAAMAKSAR